MDVLRTESAQADIVVPDAFLDVANPNSYDEVIRIDGAAMDAIAEGLKGTDKPLIVSSGTLMVAPDPNGVKTNEKPMLEPKPIAERIRCEQHALSLVDKGVKVTAIRLAPFVYGRGGSGVSQFMALALNTKQAVYVGDGHWCTSRRRCCRIVPPRQQAGQGR